MSLPVPTPDLGADSPFIEGTTLQYAWDSVSLTAAMACWRRYYYTIVLGLQPKGPGRAIALDFGIAFHKGLEHFHNFRARDAEYEEALQLTVQIMQYDLHYTRLPADEEVQQDKEAAGEEDDGIQYRNAKVRTRYHLMRALVWYLEHYRDDPASTIIMQSGKPAVEVSFRVPIPAQVGGRDVLLSGHIDRAVEFNGGYYAADYKTTKGLSRQFFADFELSHQLTGYTVAGQIIFDKPVAGAIIDGIALQVGGVQFQRHLTTRTQGQIDEYFETVQQTMDEAERCAGTGNYPMNTSACYFCHFKELCTKPPEYREHYQKMLFDSKPAWNPLENR